MKYNRITAVILGITLIIMPGCGKTINEKQQTNSFETELSSVETESNYIESNSAENHIIDEKKTETTTTTLIDENEAETLFSSVTEESITASSIDNNSSVVEIYKSDIDDVKIKLDEAFYLLRESGAQYALKMLSLSDDMEINVGNCNNMISASLIKLFVASTVYERFDVVKEFEAYSNETEDLINIMISNSDNDACNLLVTRLGSGDPALGMSLVNDFCLNHGFNDTKMNRLMLDFNGLENYTSVNDCSKILKCFYNNEITGSEKIINYMKNQSFRSKIPAGITDGTIVANKTGELSNVENDVAIIYADSGIYILCIMTNGLSDTYTAREAIVKSSSIIYDYMK